MKILVIDDSMLYQRLNVTYLKEYFPDAEYCVSANGLEGYETYLKENPDYIILDLLMPVMNGVEFLHKLKENHPDTKTKIFVISADVQKIVKDEILSLGVLKFINKPFSVEKAEEIATIIRGE
ncbi:response regulator [Anaerovorax odorimutans]|uniref:response regulator n=1 Tax=Anaerovorax odorimutans TaxID=109327 RepID=UPI0003F821A3|nr:response regulator [Anaerovorax odorimutans]